MYNIFLLTEGTWGQIITGATTIILAIIGYLKIKAEVKEVKGTVEAVKETVGVVKVGQEKMDEKINGHLSKQIENTAELNRLIGEKTGRKELITEQQDVKDQKKLDDLHETTKTPLPSASKEDEHLKDISDNTKKTADNTKKTGPVNE